MVTLKDVARAAGVSKMTVSNVLNGRSGQVSAETSRRVLEAVAELGYAGNAAARALSASRSGIVLFVYGAPLPEHIPYGNPHDTVLLQAIERRVTEAGKHLMVRSSADVSEVARQLGSWNADGAILYGPMPDEVEALRAAHDVPMVFVDAVAPTPAPVAAVGLDDQLGGYLATRHLVEAGHRNIAFVGPVMGRPGVVADRQRGYLQAMEETEGATGGWFHAATVFYGPARDLVPELLADPRGFTAAVATADIIAVGLLKGIEDQGMRVPDDFSVVGFDDIYLAELVTPPLTTVHQDVHEKGRLAADLLIDQIEHGAKPARVLLQPELRVRASVGPPQGRSGRSPGR